MQLNISSMGRLIGSLVKCMRNYMYGGSRKIIGYVFRINDRQLHMAVRVPFALLGVLELKSLDFSFKIVLIQVKLVDLKS